MEVDSPASPPAAETQEEPAIIPQEERPSQKEPMDTDMRNVQEKPQGRKPSQFEQTEQKIAPEIYREKDRKGRRGYSTPEYQEMYANVKSLQISFQRIAALGDVYNIYRNRHGWIGRTEEEVLDVASQIMRRIPSAKRAVLSYIGLLVHESTNSFFTKSENPQYAVDFSVVQGATIKLVGDWLAMLKDTTDEGIFFETLSYCCDLASEIAEHNNGRPAMKLSRTPESQSAIFASCPTIASVIRLLDYLIEKLLNENSEKCMNLLFYCSRHGTNFHWVWVHIADKFPGKVVKRIFTIGGQHFKTYADAFQAKLKERAPLITLNQMHDDYRTRFSSLAEVFNLLTRKGNVDLKGTVTKMLTESLEADVADAAKANYNIVFLFKLVTISPDTLRFLVEQNQHLMTPLNLFRGMLQILSLEKDVILQSVPYPEFAKQMMNELSPDSQCVVFKALARLALDPLALKGITARQSQSNINTITEAAFTAMNELVEVMLANTHSSDPCPLADYSTISSFANGSDLQFMIDSSLSSPNHAPQIIRYLHTVSVTFAATKAAEIVSRFILSAHETHKLHVLCAFLSTVVPFHPGLMKTVYKEIFTTREAYLVECSKDSSKTDFQRSVAFITNMRTLLEWDLTVEDASFKSNELNPRTQIGSLIAGILSMAIDTCNQELRRGNVQNIQLMISEVGRFLKSFIPSANKEKAQQRSIVVKVRYIYKISLQLAHLLKISLLAISKKEEHSLFCFEEFRSSIILFYSDSINQLHVNGTTRKPGMAQLFFVSFLASCLLDNKDLFGEEVDLDPWKDPSIEQLKLGDDDEKEYSYLDALQSMDTHQKISMLAHSGVIGTGAKRLHPPSVSSEDQLIRTHVFLDAIRNICVTDSPSNDVINTRYLANYLSEVICQDALAGDVLFQDWELEKETLGKHQIVQNYYKSFILKGLVNIVSEVQPCLWLCLSILKALLADILSNLLSTTNRTAKVSEHIMDLADDWMILARSGKLVPERFEFFIDFLPIITVHEAYLLFLEVWRYFQRRSVTMNAIEHAVETEKTMRGAGAALLEDSYEGDLQMCRRIIQQHIAELGWLFPLIFLTLEEGEIMQS